MKTLEIYSCQKLLENEMLTKALQAVISFAKQPTFKMLTYLLAKSDPEYLQLRQKKKKA